MSALRTILIASCLFIINNLTIKAQDAYHSNLANQIQTEFGVSGGSWVFGDNEANKMAQVTSYGLTMNTTSITGQDFSIVKNALVTNPGPNPYSNAVLLSNTNPITTGERLVLVFWGKGISSENDGYGFGKVIIERAGPPYEQELNVIIPFTNGWQQYMLPFETATSYDAGEFQFSLQLGYEVQELEIAGIALLNYSTVYPLEQLPQKNFNDYYNGIEANAAWRTDAAARIEQHRKSNLTLQIVDSLGNPLENATIDLAMQCHEFAFGSAVVSAFFAGNSAQNQAYEDKITNLDGQGHGFNMIVFENDLKWDAWEETWSGTIPEKENAINWLRNKDIRVRGHALVWPGWQWMPDDMETNQNDPAYLINRVDGHLQNILGNPTINTEVEEWDVLNEITVNRDLENALAGYQNYTTGREVYPEIFNTTANLDPDTKLYINDYMTITSGGLETNRYNQYKNFLTELTTATNIDGIGFQSHIGSFPVSPQKVYDILEDFHLSYGKEMKITEFDMLGVNASINYEYMRDFMTISFSHPSVNGFLMWGFWDGAHWLDNAPMFDENWNLKPGGQAFIDLVFNEWWTDETSNTDTQGESTIRGFRGKYLATITHNGATEVFPLVLSDDETLQIVFGAGLGCPIAGMPCDDDDFTTENDMADGNCNCLGTPIPSTCNTIINGDFSEDLTAWGAWGATSLAPNNEAFIEITNPGANPWSIGFSQNNLVLENGKEYTLSFDARTATARTINVKLGEAAAPYANYFYGNNALTTTMATFSHTFTMSQATDSLGRLEFHLGQYNGDVFIDNVELVETSCVPLGFCDRVGPAQFAANQGDFVGVGCATILENGEIQIDIPAATTDPWGVIFQQNEVNYEQGKQYEITFDARAVANRTIYLKNGMSAAPYTSYAYATFQLGTNMQSYRTIFTMEAATDPSSRFEFFLGNDAANVYFDNIHVREIGCGETTNLDLKVWLEGCYSDSLSMMTTGLSDKKLLPGQLNNAANLSIPYTSPPWNFTTTASIVYDDFFYENIVSNTGNAKVIDWILVSFRTGIEANTTIGQKAALLMENGHLLFPESVDFLETGESYYILLEHWSHLGILSANPILVNERLLSHDFTTQNSYQLDIGSSSKELSTGIWGMYAGNAEQVFDSLSYDINVADILPWEIQNGMFNIYHPADFNMDGDVNAIDRILWRENNGIFSLVRR